MVNIVTSKPLHVEQLAMLCTWQFPVLIPSATSLHGTQVEASVASVSVVPLHGERVDVSYASLSATALHVKQVDVL